MAKTKINYSNVKNALLWLNEHNRLYKDIDTETFVSVTPHVVDESEAVMSVYNNIEEVYEVFAIFPDKNLPCSTNGGCENSGELKDLTIERLLWSGGSKDATLICRPTKNILRDYQGNNLLLAYPVQFPYGIGCKDSKGDYRAGYPYLKHLCSLSHPNFHRANWVCVLYNMMERLRMIRASYLKTKEEEREMFCKITSDEMASAVSRFAKKQPGNSPADLFLKRMRAVTGSMSHSVGAAKNARQKMFAMVATLGLPCVLFTITLEDGVNFRIKVMASGDAGSDVPPSPMSDEEVLRKYISESQTTRVENPGFCSVDFLSWNSIK
ncbi:hypothetical protein IV203_037574 [Nitzschia inconspicua]|uniref:Uncharacterized protein n=1 Tax=Nitzschia inconspicua TaxID=303405 RepID=A0A9K3LLK3_9STRA|nr:hypothetical protein IV203_037574 [Nitzschia inconspicua]